MNSSRRISAWGLMTLGFLAAALACGKKGSGPDAGHPSEQIAFIVKTLNNPFFNDMDLGAKMAASKLGVRILVQAAEREVDIEKQMQIVENMIQRRVDALCITPSGSREIVQAIVKANEAGIPVLIIDTRVDAATQKEAGARTATFIGSDNFEGGKMAGQFMANALGGKGKVAILEGIPGHETSESRMRGFREAISAWPEIEITVTQTANWERDQGYNVFQNILQAHDDLDGLFACSDLMALGAIEAIAEAGKTDQIKVVGFDAIIDARDAIKAGAMIGTVAQNPKRMGQIAIEKAVELLRGGSIAPHIDVPLEMIDSTNVQTIDDDQ